MIFCILFIFATVFASSINDDKDGEYVSSFPYPINGYIGTSGFGGNPLGA